MSNQPRLRTVGAGGLQRPKHRWALGRRRYAAAARARQARRDAAYANLALATGQRQAPAAGSMPRRTGSSTSGTK
jgi:hypothetical protein